MEHGDQPDQGGYAAVKAVIEKAKAESQSQGIDTVVLDAGDFSDGNAFFFADEGRHSWRIIDAMGFDAIAVGNHDWLVGPDHMNQIASALRLKTPFLAANIRFSAEHASIDRAVDPFVEIRRDDLKIGILGLTTDELVYRWRVRDGSIGNPALTAKKYLPTLKSRNDLVLILSHLGLKTDIKTIAQTEGADLVVGGHSHTTLHAPVIAQDLNGNPVPIVQAGSHGEWVGSILMDVEPGQKPILKDYHLIPVAAVEGESPEAAPIRTLVTEGRRLLEQRYSPEWLYETIGFSSQAIERPKEASTAWGSFFMETIRESAGADLSIDPGEFHGVSQPAGIVTRETLMKAYPRVFEMKNLLGWSIWKIRVPGWMIHLLIDQVVRQGLHINTAGLTFEVESSEKGARVKHVKINGRSVNWMKNYTMAVTEGIGRGAVEISTLLQLFFNPRDTGVPVWTALERRLVAAGGDFARAPGSTTAGMIASPRVP
jgi:2',3'-cyclic-nucleotide 2'-phosphodiesterase (5'-nucleotidase family)